MIFKRSSVALPSHAPLSFADRASALRANGTPPRFPSQDEVRPDDIDELVELQTRLPSFDHDIRLSIMKPTDHNVEVREVNDETEPRKQSRTRLLLWPTFALCVPITLLAMALLLLVLLYKVKPRDSLFNNAPPLPNGPPFILVDFPATRLVFVASFLSTVAPLLATFVMSLCSLLVARDLRDAQVHGDVGQLPTPFQLSVLIGMLAATLDEIRAYIWYHVSKGHKPTMPPILNKAAFVFGASMLLAAGVFVADTVLHYTTSTVEFDQITLPIAPHLELGRGLSQTCLEFNRTALYGWPCSVMIGWEDPNFYFEQNEAERLAHNSSSLSEIRMASPEAASTSSVAYLMPRVQSLPQGLDFEATTIGVSTDCKFVPPADCGMARWGEGDIYTNFSCSNMFHGTLGKTPNVSEADGYRAPDPYRSYLMYKPAANLMYSFFNDSGLQTIYNTPGYNDTGQLDPATNPLPDSELVNPFYVAFAMRMATSQFQPTSGMLSSQSEIFGGGDQIYIDFIMNCAVKSYEVDYVWVEGELQELSTSLTSNGSVLEIFHGSDMYTTLAGVSIDLQDFMIQAGLVGNTTQSFLQKFGSLYSTKVLAKIGAYTTTRTVLAQQDRDHLLLSKVYVSALAALLACSLTFLVFGLVLAWRAYRAVDMNVGVLASQLSLLGVITAATQDKLERIGNTDNRGSSTEPKESSKEELKRVGVRLDSHNRFQMSTWL